MARKKSANKTAFSAEHALHERVGASKKIKYVKGTYTESSWDGTVFTVPEDGLYYLSVSFVRDSQDKEIGDRGTNDDTQIHIWVYKTWATKKRVAFAWAGEASTSRQGASAAVAVPLKKGMKVTTTDWAEYDQFRRFRNCLFAGFKVGEL